jgi:putative transcriptional regulator
MKVTHHPSDSALAYFVSGTLDEGRSLVVATHLSLCPACRSAVRTLENLGGELLDRTEPVNLRADALERALREIGEVETPIRSSTPANPKTGALPAPLSMYALGPRRWIGRGLRWQLVAVPCEWGNRVLLLDAAPGSRLPHHRHAGSEWTCVLQGAFRTDKGRYGPGDFEEADENVEHAPAAEDGPHCVCLIALNGKIRFRGWFGRLLQPLFRFW